MEKPRISYAEAFGMKHQKNSISDLVERYVRDMRQPGARGISDNQEAAMRLLQRDEIGNKQAEYLKRSDYTALAQRRRANLIPTHRRGPKLAEISPATVNKMFSDLSVILTHAHDEWEVPVKLDELKAAMRKLRKDGYISKAQARTRRTSEDEFAALLAHFAKQNEYERTEIDMVEFAQWQRNSGRRRGESCALLWEDWNREKQTILVRKMKDPRRKNKAKVVALPDAAQAQLERLYEKRDPEQPRIFPYDKRSVSCRYTEAKKALGILNLRLHDLRADCATRLVEVEKYTPAQAILVTGHETTTIFEKVYMRLDAARMVELRRQEKAA